MGSQAKECDYSITECDFMTESSHVHGSNGAATQLRLQGSTQEAANNIFQHD